KRRTRNQFTSKNNFIVRTPDFRFGSKADIILGPRDVPLYPQKRTLLSVIGMSALCQKQTFAASFESRPRQLGDGAETVSRCGSTVQSLAFRQASGIGGGSVPPS